MTDTIASIATSIPVVSPTDIAVLEGSLGAASLVGMNPIAVTVPIVVMLPIVVITMAVPADHAVAADHGAADHAAAERTAEVTTGGDSAERSD